MKKFVLGAIAGFSTIALAAPLFAQGTANTTNTPATDVIPSQACIEALASQESEQLSRIDAMITAQKDAMSVHQAALKVAAGITDDDERQAAVKKANDIFRASMKSMMESQEDRTTQREALRTACGDYRAFGMGFGMGMGMGKGPMDGHRNGARALNGVNDLAEKLGMTETELQAALDGGKTLEEIAEEKGVEMPLPPRGNRGMHGQSRGWDTNKESD